MVHNKLIDSKTIISIPNATREDIEKFRLALNDPKNKQVLVNAKCRVYIIKKGELFEVTNKLHKIKNLRVRSTNG